MHKGYDRSDWLRYNPLARSLAPLDFPSKWFFVLPELFIRLRSAFPSLSCEGWGCRRGVMPKHTIGVSDCTVQILTPLVVPPIEP